MFVKGRSLYIVSIARPSNHTTYTFLHGPPTLCRYLNVVGKGRPQLKKSAHLQGLDDFTHKSALLHDTIFLLFGSLINVR